jgi:hypothetical protein
MNHDHFDLHVLYRYYVAHVHTRHDSDERQGIDLKILRYSPLKSRLQEILNRNARTDICVHCVMYTTVWNKYAMKIN